jgi:hypothetical protein
MKKSAFDKAQKLMRDIHNKKSHDYANSRDRFSNFRIAALIAGVSVDTVFRVMDGIKIARLIELLDSKKKPKNESIFDSILDKATYDTLRLAFWIEQNENRSRGNTRIRSKSRRDSRSRYEGRGKKKGSLYIRRRNKSRGSSAKIQK